MNIIKSLLADDAGIVATEYVIMVALVALAIIVGAGILGGQINNALNDIGNRVAGCGSAKAGSLGTCS